MMMKETCQGWLAAGLSALFLLGWGSFAPLGAAPFAYIPGSGDNRVSILDTAFSPPAVVATIGVGTDPRGVATVVKAAETLALVTHFGGEDVSVIRTYMDPVTEQVAFEKVRDIRVGRNPYGIAVDPAGAFAYAANYTDGTVSKIDLASYGVTATIPVGSNPIGVAANPNGTAIYVVNSGSDSVSVIDAADNTRITTVAVGLGPYGLAVDPAGTFVYVANGVGNSLSIIRASDLSVTTRADFRLETPSGVAVNPAGTTVYITNYSGGTLSLFDAVGGTFSAPNIGVGVRPVGVSLSLDGRYTYVASLTDGTLCVIDNATNTEKPPRTNIGLLPYALGLFVARFGSANPTVTATLPAKDAKDVLLGATIQAVFSDTMDASTINTSTFVVSGGVTGAVTYDSLSKTALLKPAENLKKKTLYTVTLTTGIKNTMGNALASNYTWSFTTTDKSDGSCFIATAAYGSPDDAHVQALRAFRDRYLLSHSGGEVLVALYYRYSPPVADLIRERPWLRAAARGLLAPVVYFVRHPFRLALMLGLVLAVVAGTRKTRR